VKTFINSSINSTFIISRLLVIGRVCGDDADGYAHLFKSYS